MQPALVKQHTHCGIVDIPPYTIKTLEDVFSDILNSLKSIEKETGVQMAQFLELAINCKFEEEKILTGIFDLKYVMLDAKVKEKEEEGDFMCPVCY
jgi:hypothetical protein